MKKQILFIIVLLMSITPVVDAKVSDSGHTLNAQASHDIVIDSISWWSFPIYCLTGDTLSGEFKVVSNGDLFPGDQTKYDNWLLDGIDFLIFDEENYSHWIDGLAAFSIFEKQSLVQLQWSIEVPHNGVWYVVYSNDSVYMKEIAGTIERASPEGIVYLLIGITGVISVSILFSAYRYKK